ncbi:unnamed protein product [Trichogramma brassicae]|uniref:Uncharacterized protein n=1 Tax=Trichogramma brassicae TaxID=86971 RepID=A0A6H5ILL3_9HYME|nr:unnamed protein product [Trichogramma brassicae]
MGRAHIRAYVCVQYRRTRTTGVSPAFLNLGRNPEIGHSVRRKEAEAALIAEEDEARIAWAMRMENLSGIRDKATENSQQAQERQAQYYNKKRRDVTFKANDKVWRRNRILSSGAKGIAAKLKRRFRGPCKVSKVLGSNVYQLIGESGELVEKVTASDLKPCYGRSSTAESDERHSATANVTRVKSTTAAVSDERKSAATDVTSGGGRDGASGRGTNSRNRKLPTLQLPTFSGKYADWKPYKDLFQAIMKDATDITDVERFYYLNSSLTEDAAKTIKNLAVTEENYKRAWDRLVSHYDNKRALVHSALSELFTISPLTKESSKALRELRDRTNEVVETLEALGRPIRCDDVLVFMTVQRLDPNTGRDWQTSRASTTEPPSYEDLDSFLKTRVEALEFVEMPKATADQGLPGKSSRSSASSRSGTNQARVSTYTASSQPSRTDNPCTYCKQEHYIAACDRFRALELGERKAFVQRNKLCFNCLGRHLMRDCRSNKSCKRCQGRHHSLLHMSNSQATADASGSLDATQDISVNTHIARRGPRRSILLATARIIVSASQRTMEVRALIDPCSEATFISEALEQQLRIPQQTALVPVTGVGGARCATAKHQASISIRPHFDNGKDWTVQALILTHLSDYVPPQYELIHRLAFSDGLKLADYNVKAADKVDVIIGADLFPTLIKGGLRRGPDSALIAQATELGWILTGATDSRLTAAQESATIASHSIGVDTELHELMERFCSRRMLHQQALLLQKKNKNVKSILSRHIDETNMVDISCDCRSREMQPSSEIRNWSRNARCDEWRDDLLSNHNGVGCMKILWPNTHRSTI